LSVFASAISSYAAEDIEDLIDIAESKGKIIAIIEGRRTITFDLRPNEKVLWSGSKGYLGAFLTDLHKVQTSSCYLIVDIGSNILENWLL
jgi:hypothetical protein